MKYTAILSAFHFVISSLFARNFLTIHIIYDGGHLIFASINEQGMTMISDVWNILQ